MLVRTATTAAQAAPVPVTPLQVGTLRIGEGAPRTIVPITGATAEQALQQAAVIAASPSTDMAEWRIDYLDIATDGNALGRARQAHRARAGTASR